jgi:hypothetical protein
MTQPVNHVPVNDVLFEYYGATSNCDNLICDKKTVIETHLRPKTVAEIHLRPFK